MQNIWMLFLILVLQVGPVLAQSELGALIGRISTDNRYSISMLGFGIEQFEGERRTTHRFQLWDISCHYPPYAWDGQPPNETHCSVTRTVLDRSGEDSGFGTMIGQHSHYASDGTLKLTHVDWNAGELDLQLTLTDKTTIEVMLRVQYQDTDIYLKDFKAIGIARGMFSDTMEAIEYRIPEYSYTLDIPVQMKGLKSEDDRKLDEMLQSLTEEDRSIWEKMQREGAFPSDSVDIESRMKELVPDYEDIEGGKRDFSPEELRMLGVVMLENFEKGFEAQGFSEDGLKKILDLMKVQISKMR